MKRHSSLAPLSREHHQALILSQLMKKNAPEYKGMPKDTEGKALYASNFYNTHLATHFIKEEKVLAELNGINSILDVVIKEIFQEHKVLRESIAKIKTTNEMEAHLDLLGKSLEKHIRKEERILFPMIEEYAGAAMLLRIENILNH